MNRLAVLHRKFMALSHAERFTLLVAAALMPAFWLGLRLLGLQRFHAWLRRAPPAPQSAMDFAATQALGELVNIAARHTLGPRSCLTRSLLLGWLLRRRGVASDLRIGVRITNGAFNAHAWVECEGVPVNDKPEVSTQFASFGDLVPLAAFQTP